jgi:integrase
MSKRSKANGQRKRGKRGMGRLFKKQGAKQFPADSPAAGTYYLTYIVNGQRKTESLRDQNGEPITDRKAAEAARRKTVAPYITGDKVETLKAVRAALSDAETEHAQAVEEANPPLRIVDGWTAYAGNPERPDSGNQTLTRYEGHWTRFAAWLGNTHPDAAFLRDVTPTIAGEYAGDVIRAGYGANTFNKHVSFLRLLFRVLADAARITANPFARIKPKVLRPHSRRELTMQELTTILDRADGDLALLLYLGACTGLRLGDCCTLTWRDVHLARRIILRIPNKTARKGKPVKLGIPWKLEQRLVSIPPRVRTGYVLPGMAERYRRDVALVTNAVKAHILDCGIDVHAAGTGERIKRKSDGTPERDETTGQVITEETGKPAVVEVGFHSLRHTWVSMHAARGTPQAVIQDSVGHANPAMTAHYTHIDEGTARDVALALPIFAETAGPLALPATAGPAGEAHRDLLPAWAEEAIRGMTAKTWKAVRDDLLKGVA